MFREIILPIFRSIRLCVTVCGIMHRPATAWVHYTTSCNTQSSAPEEGLNNCPKPVELTRIINKPLLLHLVDCLHYLYQWCTVKRLLDNEMYLLIKYVKNVLWRVAKRLSYIEHARCLKDNMTYYVDFKILSIIFQCYKYSWFNSLTNVHSCIEHYLVLNRRYSPYLRTHKKNTFFFLIQGSARRD